ncbi:type III pantothenate kinase [Simiduia agarivorans]|uniref:Type III pantothenate kinase n=1 Tax=Simiduia agarivorans (strain DSM 21679 / JCM 13881 / BCRC 17597 / SA1) TaxID=1117647 RepID=K4KJ19_SIMAS|nr:type III pantothenate kinase [Simiduia agarivorans]AFU99036.1 pantothenate kinase [Simiduia agarivorans SA1 = DSM 21679]
MIVEFDCGNTAVKWRTADGAQRGGQPWAALKAKAGFDFSGLGLPAGLTRARLASVAGEARTGALVNYLACTPGIPVALAQVVPGANGVSCGYAAPERLGIDRWLAVQAALALVPDARLLVVDVGSAVTLDVCEPGRHLGGFIGPGLQLMRTALYSGTHAVKVPDLPGTMPLAPGVDTQQAVSGALALMLSGLVHETARRFGPVDYYLFTGGAGGLLAREFTPSRLVPDLVLDGLALVLP